MHVAIAALVLSLAQVAPKPDQRDATLFLPHMCTLMLSDKAAGPKILQCWSKTAEDYRTGDVDIRADGLSIDELGRLCKVAGGRASKDGNVSLVVTARDGSRIERGCEIQIPPRPSGFRVPAPGQGG